MAYTHPTLSAELSLEGLTEAGVSATDFGKAVEAIDPVAAKLDEALAQLGSSLAAFSAAVDKEVEHATKRSANVSEKQQKVAERKAAALAQAEENRLRAYMAQMLGGGVNAFAYQQQLQKVADQQELIRQAESRGLISKKESLEALVKLTAQYGKLKLEAKAYTTMGGGMLGRFAAGLTHRLTSAPGALLSAGGSQISGIGTGLAGLGTGLLAGAGIGGLFGLLVYGQLNADRIKAETGEIVNIAVSGAGELTSKGAGFLGSFQQTAEHYYGINRQEIQGVLKDFLSAGLKVNDVLKDQKNQFGEVGKNALTLAIGIDKNFELASGTSAKGMISLVHDFGLGLKEAGDLYTKLAFAGQQSGMGTENFTNTVMQASSALRSYGVSVENVSTVLLKLQSRYESMGMPKQLAGMQAQMGLQQISQGLSSMGAGMQSYFGERMGMGTGLEGRMRFREGMDRLKSGTASNEFYSDYVREAYRTAMEASGGNKIQARQFLEASGIGGGVEGSRAIVEVGEHLEKGGKLSELNAKQVKDLRGAFKTEGQKTSDLEKAKHTILMGISDVSQGLLQVMTNFVAYGIVFFKGLPVLLYGTKEEKQKLAEVQHDFTVGINKGIQQMWGGTKGIAKGAYAAMSPVLGPLVEAFSWDPFGGSQQSKAHGLAIHEARENLRHDVFGSLATAADRDISRGQKELAKDNFWDNLYGVIDYGVGSVSRGLQLMTVDAMKATTGVGPGKDTIRRLTDQKLKEMGGGETGPTSVKHQSPIQVHEAGGDKPKPISLHITVEQPNMQERAHTPNPANT